MIAFAVPAMQWLGKTGVARRVVVGYYARGARPANERLQQYVAWREHVRFYASLAGLELPWRVTKKSPRMVYVRVYFATGNHADVENVRKGILDSLVYVSREERELLGPGYGSDKWIGGGHSLPRYDRESPRAEVFVSTPEEWRLIFHEESL